MKQKIMSSTILTNETGRSMVEMLGVLAIVGVLSVGGVYGYGVAMKKHKANELLHQASMLATTVSAQIMSGKNPTTLDSFTNSDLGTFTLETYTDGDNTFKLKISDIDDDVCEQMKSSMGGMVRDIVCDENAKTALMTFNKDLSTTDLPKTESVIDKNITNPEDCQKAGKTWCVEASSGSGQCSNSTDCCQGVAVPPCQDCTSGEGTYSFTNGIPYTECDSDGDGSNDGQCLPDESGNPPFTCQQVSCQETESCCAVNNMDNLEGVLNDPSTLEAMGISLSTLAKQAHQAQCSSCDPSDGKTTPLADGTNCFYYSDTSSVEMMQQFFAAGQCQSGSCTTDRPCDFQHLENCCLPYTTDPFEFATEEIIQMLGWEKIADLLNHYQCGTCDRSSLQIQSKLDGEKCEVVELYQDEFMDVTISKHGGVCKSGKCEKKSCKTNADCSSGEFCFCNRNYGAPLEEGCEWSCVEIGSYLDKTLVVNDERYASYNGKKIRIPENCPSVATFSFDWHSARNWCKANGMDLLDLDITCDSSSNHMCYEEGTENYHPVAVALKNFVLEGTPLSGEAGWLLENDGVKAKHVPTFWNSSHFLEDELYYSDGSPLCE